jgi:prepilin-type processing-associated H-X9-DG protein
VVIGIIGLLVSLLLPALKSARKSAVRVACASNMRQLGTAIYMYANDNRSFIPYASMDAGPAPNAAGNVYTWDDLLNRFVSRRDSDADLKNQWLPKANPLLECGEDAYDRRFLYSLYNKRSYAIVENTLAYNSQFYGVATRAFTFTTGWPVNTYFRCVKFNEVAVTAQTLMLVENPMPNNAGPNVLGHGAGALVSRPSDQGRGLVKPYHNHRWNYLFVDGHVGLLAPEDTIRAPNIVTSLPANYMWTRAAD